MKEFIFTWSIENISYCWHRKGKSTSFSFTANTVHKTSWILVLYPKCVLTNWISLYIYRDFDSGPRDFLFDCEFSCISANNLVITSQNYLQNSAAAATECKIGCERFLKWHEIFFSKKTLYLSKDTLKLRCRIWTHDGDVHEIGQSSGHTRLDIERILSVKHISLGMGTKESLKVYSRRQQKSIISISTYEEGNSLLIEMNPIYVKHVKSHTYKIYVEGRKKKRVYAEHITSWLGDPCRELWRLHLPNAVLETQNKTSPRNQGKLVCEFIYAPGIRRKTVQTFKPCSFKFSEFSTNTILSCIPSGKLFDCPNLSKDLWNLYTKRILCDVELKTPTTSFWVHKAVLCARSPVFSTMFDTDMKEKLTNCVEIEDLEDETLGNLVKFLYTNNFEESQWESVWELYHAADKYQIEGLKIMCSSYFMKNIGAFKVGELLILADQHCDSYLKSRLDEYIVRRHEAIFSSPMWKEFTEKHPQMSVNAMLCKYEEARGNETSSEAHKLLSCTNIIKDFKSLYYSRKGSDIAIQSSTSTFPTHKTVLASASYQFRKIFTRDQSVDILKAGRLENDTIYRMLLFLYTDSLGDTTWEVAAKLYHAAAVHQIERLKVKCSCLLLENLEASNAADILLLAHIHNDYRFESLVKDFICLHDKEVITYQGWSKWNKPRADHRERQSKRLRLI